MVNASDPIYITHDNGGRPFKVRIIGYTAIVTNNVTGEELFTQTYERIFIGESDGNSILLHVANDEYMYIGHDVRRFNHPNRIIQYKSPIGNSNVPYPYAIDEYANHLLMIEHVIIDDCDGRDPYEYYYSKTNMTPVQRRGNAFLNITEFYIGNIEYTMSYHPNPGSNYDRLVEDIDHEISVVHNGERRGITRDEYIEINNMYGQRMGFNPLDTTVVVPRLW